MFGKLFKSASRQDQHDRSWWCAAEVAAQAPTVAALDDLRSAVASGREAPDEHERQTEMIEGLQLVAALAASATLPVVETQHRVIGGDRCHFLAPASPADQTGGGGKLLLTSQRVVFVSGGTPRAWPWHRVTAISRSDRDVQFVIGGADAMLIRCNTFGDALAAAHLGERLRDGARASSSMPSTPTPDRG